MKYLRLKAFLSCWITWSKLRKSIPITFPLFSFFSLQCYLWIQELPGCLIQRRQTRGSAWNSESLGAGKLCCWLVYLCYSAKPSEFGNLALFISVRPFFLPPSWPLWLHLPKVTRVRYEAVYQHPQGRCSQAAEELKNSRILEVCEAFGVNVSSGELEFTVESHFTKFCPQLCPLDWKKWVSIVSGSSYCTFV